MVIRINKALLFQSLTLVLITGIFPVFSQKEIFTPLEAPNSCFPKPENQPRCNFSVKASFGNRLTTKCIQNVGSVPAFQIKGEFEVLRIICAADYAIDSRYYGIQPTEARFVEWYKRIRPNSDRAIEAWVADLKVYSVEGLFAYYNNPNNSYYESRDENQNHTKKHDYSRTGNYTFPGIFDPHQALGPSFYLFLEDTAKMSLLRNNRTKITRDDRGLRIPCLPSHYDPKRISMELQDSTGVLLSGDSLAYNPIDGFTLQMLRDSDEMSYYGNYTCTMKVNGETVDSMVLPFKQDWKTTEYYYGLDDYPRINMDTNIEFSSAVAWNNDLQRSVIYPFCKIKNLETGVDPASVFMISIPAINFAKMRDIQLFPLPNFYNQSYTVRFIRGDERTWDSLTREIRIQDGSLLRMGTRFCAVDNRNEIGDYGSGLLATSVINFGFSKDWAYFDRRISAVETHFQLKILTVSENLYANTTISFSCSVNIPVVVQPIIWYTLRKDGTIVEEAIDNNIDGETSTFSKKLPIDVERIYCSGSYWYSTYWRNISLPLKLKEGSKANITSTDTVYKFKLGSRLSQIRCQASGFPVPEIQFKKGENIVSQSVRHQNFVVLTFGVIEKDTFGKYTCVAKNEFDTVEKEFTVELDDDGDTDLGVTLGVPVAVFILTVIGAYVYIRFFRPEKTGLTKEEVEEFMKGLKQEELPSGKGEYAHDFAHMCPYTGEHEISSSRFKIDHTRILGSGAFGVVMKGLIDGEEVAIKTIKRNADKQYLKALLSELKIMIYLGNHPNLVTFMGAYTKELQKGNVYVFVKFFALGNLEGFLRNNKAFYAQDQGAGGYSNISIDNRVNSKHFDFEDLVRWSIQLADGMDFLGSKKVIHGDLASRNVLLDVDKCVKITDFGLSRQLYDYSDYVKKQQEPLPWRWMALESLKYLSFSTASDVWAYGITIWEIFSLGEVPYPGYSWNLDFVEILEGGLRMSRPKYATELIYKILCECWHEIPEKRPSFKTLSQRFQSVLDELQGNDYANQLVTSETST